MNNVYISAGLKTLAFMAFIAATSFGTVYLLETFIDYINPTTLIAGVVLMFCIYVVYSIFLTQERYNRKFKKSE